MKKMQKMIAVLFSVAMCAAMAVPAFAAETDTARNEEQETVMPRAIVYEEINIPGDGKFYKITDDFEMPAKSRVSFQGTWSPAYARLEFRLYAHSTGNGAYVMLTSGREGGLDATAASVYSLYARSVDIRARKGNTDKSERTSGSPAGSSGICKEKGVIFCAAGIKEESVRPRK